MNCIECQADLGAPRASIAVLGHGDEHILTWFWCNRCRVYTGEDYHDSFLGDSRASVQRVDAADGDRKVAQVATCSDRQNKFCSCAAHQAISHL